MDTRRAKVSKYLRDPAFKKEIDEERRERLKKEADAEPKRTGFRVIIPVNPIVGILQFLWTRGLWVKWGEKKEGVGRRSREEFFFSLNVFMLTSLSLLSLSLLFLFQTYKKTNTGNPGIRDGAVRSPPPLRRQWVRSFLFFSFFVSDACCEEEKKSKQKQSHLFPLVLLLFFSLSLNLKQQTGGSTRTPTSSSRSGGFSAAARRRRREGTRREGGSKVRL